MSAKTNNKGVAWLYNEVCALLDIWADPEIQQQLAGRLHNMCVYEKISKKLEDLDIHRTGEQCREKIKKLRRDYKTVVDNKYSPAFARKVLGCYDKVHEIFGKCTIAKPSFVIESIVYNENFSRKKKEVEIDSASFQTTQDSSISESEKPKHTIGQQTVDTDSSDTLPPDISYEKRINLSDAVHKDTTNEQNVRSYSSNNIHMDPINEQNDTIEFSDASNLNIKNQTNFINAFGTTNIKYSKQKSNWNTYKRKIERRVKKQKFLYKKLLKRQAVLHNKFIELERKKFLDEIEQEHKRLSMFETERQRHNETEINLFKSLLQMMAEKQGVKLSFQGEDVG